MISEIRIIIKMAVQWIRVAVFIVGLGVLVAIFDYAF